MPHRSPEKPVKYGSLYNHFVESWKIRDTIRLDMILSRTRTFYIAGKIPYLRLLLDLESNLKCVKLW